jgi:hypothetical protein
VYEDAADGRFVGFEGVLGLDYVRMWSGRDGEKERVTMARASRMKSKWLSFFSSVMASCELDDGGCGDEEDILMESLGGRNFQSLFESFSLWKSELMR